MVNLAIFIYIIQSIHIFYKDKPRKSINLQKVKKSRKFEASEARFLIRKKIKQYSFFSYNTVFSQWFKNKLIWAYFPKNVKNIGRFYLVDFQCSY